MTTPNNDIHPSSSEKIPEPTTWLHLWSTPSFRRKTLRTTLLLGLLAALWALREVLLPFVLAFFLSYVIDPAVTWVSSKPIFGRRLQRGPSVLVLYLAFFAIVTVFGMIFVPQLLREGSKIGETTAAIAEQLDAAHFSSTLENINQKLHDAHIPVDVVIEPETKEGEHDIAENKPVPPPENGNYRINLSELQGDLAHMASSSINPAVTAARGVVGGVVGAFVTFILVLMLTAFISADPDRVKRGFIDLINIEDRVSFDALLSRIDHGLSGVVRGQLTICLINGALTLVGLLLLQVKFAFILGTIAAVFSLIPIFGSIMSTAPIVVIALATSGFATAILSVVWIAVIHAVEANFLNPKVMGDAAKIHPVLVVFSLIAGEHFYGIVGALLAVPCISIALTIFQSILDQLQSLDAQMAHELGRKLAHHTLQKSSSENAPTETETEHAPITKTGNDPEKTVKNHESTPTTPKTASRKRK